MHVHVESIGRSSLAMAWFFNLKTPYIRKKQKHNQLLHKTKVKDDGILQFAKYHTEIHKK